MATTVTPASTEQELTFTRDPMHFPFVVCPLFQSVHPAVFAPGYLAAAREMDVPVADFLFRYWNNYQYESLVPIVPGSAAEAQLQDERAEAAIKHELGRMRQRWLDEHLPRIRELLAELAEARELDPSTPLDPTRLDDLLAIYVEAWTIHFRIAFPMLIGIQLFDEFVADIAGPEADSHAMLVGVYTESVAAGIGITDLAASARALGLASLILETPDDQLEARLRERVEGRRFLEQLGAYLSTYGLTQGIFDFMQPTWLEDPTPLYAAIRSYLETGGDNRTAHEEQVRRAERATAKMREQLATYPEPVRGQFEALLGMARDGNFLQEEHNFYIDQQAFSSFRLAFLALARQLVYHGKLDQSEDIFFLHTDEIQALLSDESIDARAIVTERRLSYEAARTLVPPPFLGPPPSGPPPDNPFTRAMGRFFGWGPPISDDPDRLAGYAGSRGHITAPAFVARSLAEASGIPAGHVLVTVTTTPSWTPLFGVAGAIVTETGGPLSHCAIVAREYGLPAVVGVAGVTSRIETGQMIHVNGTTGEVTPIS
jgi:phosphohistidine swiveling domain-containing protein